MMSVSSTTADDRFTLALPRATKIGHGLLGGRSAGRRQDEHRREERSSIPYRM
jgi:hypothetical protein